MQTIAKKAQTAMRDIIATRGPHKGQLKARAPDARTLAYAAWQGAMMALNPYKVSIGGCLFMTAEQREVMAFVQHVYETTPGATMLERNRETLESLGVW